MRRNLSFRHTVEKACSSGLVRAGELAERPLQRGFTALGGLGERVFGAHGPRVSAGQAPAQAGVGQLVAHPEGVLGAAARAPAGRAADEQRLQRVGRLARRAGPRARRLGARR